MLEKKYTLESDRENHEVKVKVDRVLRVERDEVMNQSKIIIIIMMVRGAGHEPRHTRS